jgi:predicted lactoylglutathione lyase
MPPIRHWPSGHIVATRANTKEETMARKIFVNLPVKNLDKSMAFFKKLGFEFNPQFTDENAACMIIAEDSAYAMLLAEPFFKTFTPKSIADASKTTEVLTALSQDSRAEVDRLMDVAVQSGGSELRAAQDLGFMYNRAFNDPDGHIWEIFWMDPAQIPSDPAQKPA